MAYFVFCGERARHGLVVMTSGLKLLSFPALEVQSLGQPPQGLWFRALTKEQVCVSSGEF